MSGSPSSKNKSSKSPTGSRGCVPLNQPGNGSATPGVNSSLAPGCSPAPTRTRTPPPTGPRCLSDQAPGTGVRARGYNTDMGLMPSGGGARSAARAGLSAALGWAGSLVDPSTKLAQAQGCCAPPPTAPQPPLGLATCAGSNRLSVADGLQAKPRRGRLRPPSPPPLHGGGFGSPSLGEEPRPARPCQRRRRGGDQPCARQHESATRRRAIPRATPRVGRLKSPGAGAIVWDPFSGVLGSLTCLN